MEVDALEIVLNFIENCLELLVAIEVAYVETIAVVELEDFIQMSTKGDLFLVGHETGCSIVEGSSDGGKEGHAVYKHKIKTKFKGVSVFIELSGNGNPILYLRKGLATGSFTLKCTKVGSKNLGS